MKIKFNEKDRNFVNKLFDGSIYAGKNTAGRIIRWILIGGKWIILLSIALFFVLMGFLYGASKIKKNDDLDII